MVTFTRERSESGVTERLFDLTVAGERVPAVIWSPEGAKGMRPARFRIKNQPTARSGRKPLPGSGVQFEIA